MNPKVRIDGTEYRVTDNLGFVQDIGGWVKEVDTPDGPRKIVKFRGGLWRFWTAADRLGKQSKGGRGDD